MNEGDKVKVTWPDGLTAVGYFLREERGFAVFKDDDGEQFVAMMRSSTSMEIVENKN